MYQQNLALKREKITLNLRLQNLHIDKKGKGKLDFLVEATDI
jgi:hypothetical protein